MLKIAVAVDGSECSLHAVAHAAKRAKAAEPACQIHLVNVQYPVHGSVSTFINAAQIKQYHQDEGMSTLAPARDLLDAEKVAYDYHLFVGEPGEVVGRFAHDQGCDEIIIGTRGLSAISNVLIGSVATKIIHHATVPVVLVK